MISEHPTEAQVKELLSELPERTKEQDIAAAIRKATALISNAQASYASKANGLLKAASEIHKALE